MSFHNEFKRLFLKRKGLSNGKVVSLTKKEYDSKVYFFINLHKSLNQYLINDFFNLLKLSFIWDFHNKEMLRV